MHDMTKIQNERQNPTTEGKSYHIAGNGKSRSYKYGKLHAGCYRQAFVVADGHGAFAGRERTHALVIGELVVSDVEPTAFMRAHHPQRRNDDFHRRAPHVEASTALALLALLLVPGELDAAIRASQCPPLHCTNQSNNTSIKKPAPCSSSRTDEVYSNLIHWRLKGAEAQGAVEQGEVHRDHRELQRHRDHRELQRRVLFRRHYLALLMHNHLSL